MNSSRWTSLLFLASVLEQQYASAFVPASQGSRCSLQPTLFMSKNSDRAHLEKNLEDLMDNDWRVFRARLVAQEAAEATKETTKSSSSPTDAHSDEKLGKLEQLGDLFAVAISSIFRSNKDEDIFDGLSIGGADLLDDIVSQDPFVSAEEIPMLMKPKVSLDKHRWAHVIPHVEPGCILVANEKLGGVFHQTVILIIEHNEANGSTGIVINRYVLMVIWSLFCFFAENSHRHCSFFVLQSTWRRSQQGCFRNGIQLGLVSQACIHLLSCCLRWPRSSRRIFHPS